MNDIVTNYGDLISFLASFFAIVGAVVGLVLFWWAKTRKIDEDKHNYIVEKRVFEINNLKSIKDLGFHADKDTISIRTLKTIYNDPDKSKELKNKYAGSYDQLYKIISLHREMSNGKLQVNTALAFCLCVILITLLTTCTYEINKIRNPVSEKSNAPIIRTLDF